MDFDSSRIRTTINRPTDSFYADASGVVRATRENREATVQDQPIR